MADVGKDPVPIIKKAVQITSRKKKLKFFGPVQESHIIIHKPNN